MPLINYEINFILTWSVNCVIIPTAVANQGATFAITNTKLYIPVETLLIQENVKVLDQLKSGFKRTINWNKYQSKVSIQAQKQCLDYLIDPSFQGVNKRFVLLFENNAHQTSYNRYFLLTVEIKEYNVIIDGKNFFDQPVKNDIRIYDNIQKIPTSQGDDYKTGCLLDYVYFKNYYKMIAIDLSKQKALYADPKAIQQINFIGNLDRARKTPMFFIIEEAKETIINFSQGTARVL